VIRIVDRYLLREVTLTWAGVTGVLLVILVTNQLARVLERAAEQQFPRDVVLALIGFSTLQNLTILIPVALLLAVVLAFGRLYHDSEMAAIQACGIGTRRLYAPVLALTLVLAGLLAWLALDLGPDAAGRVQGLRASALREAQFGNLEPGRFRTIGGSGAVLYASTAGADGTLREVFVKRGRDDRLEVALATRARHYVSSDGTLHTLVLENGRRYEGVPGRGDFRVTQFREHGIPVRIADPGKRAEDVELAPTAELLRSADLEAQAELQWRVSMPIMALVLAFVAVPLSRLRPRQGRYARIGYAILLYFVYSNLLSAAKVWVARGVMPAELGLWWVHLLFVALGLFVLFQRAVWLRLRRFAPLPSPA
jgi:lipopolysaccharide export system permease protein